MREPFYYNSAWGQALVQTVMVIAGNFYLCDLTDDTSRNLNDASKESQELFLCNQMKNPLLLDPFSINQDSQTRDREDGAWCPPRTPSTQEMDHA